MNKSNPEYCNFAFISLNKGLLESDAWNSLSLNQIRVFIYLYSCLQWYKDKRKKTYYPSNNGEIEVSSVKMRAKLHISKQTCSKAIHQLIKVGLIKLTRVGENKVCHKYKILYDVVSQLEERWRKYPEQDWENECPKTPNTLVGIKTRFKSHPEKVDRISVNQASSLDLALDNRQVDLPNNEEN